VLDNQVVDDGGTDYSLLPALTTLTTAINTLDADIKALKAGWGSGTTLLHSETVVLANSSDQIVVAGVAAKSIVVVGAKCSWGASAVAPRGWLVLTLEDDTFTFYDHITLSPESPTVPFTIPPGGVTLPVASNAKVFPVQVLDSAAAQIYVDIWYYLTP
jgi:hypothetical protein